MIGRMNIYVAFIWVGGWGGGGGGGKGDVVMSWRKTWTALFFTKIMIRQPNFTLKTCFPSIDMLRSASVFIGLFLPHSGLV